MNPDRGRQALLTVLGVGAGVATGVWLWRRQEGRQRYEPAGPRARPRGSAQDVAESLQRDSRLARRRIEVDAIAEGVVELSGAVRDREEAERAVSLAQRTTGVYTVVNRLRIDEEESRRESTRRRWSEGAPDLRERHHYGMGVGMGTRRQSPATDPDRPSDKQRLIERELDPAKIEDAPEPEPEPIAAEEAVPDAPTDAVAQPHLKPGDERAIEEAGLDANPPVEVGEPADGEEERP